MSSTAPISQTPAEGVVHWRAWVTKHPIGGAAVAGLIATWIATLFGFWLPGIGLPQLSWPIVNGLVVLPKSSPAVQFSAGEFIHGIDGVVFVIFFALFLFPYLGRSRSAGSNMARAMLFSMVLACISAGFLVPYVYYPHVGAGVWSTGFGWKTVFAIYLWHLAFGVNLGLFYNPLRTDDPALKSYSIGAAPFRCRPRAPLQSFESIDISRRLSRMLIERPGRESS